MDKYSEKIVSFFGFLENISFGENDELLSCSDSLFLLICSIIVPAIQRSAEHDVDLLTGRTEQFQRGNICGYSDPVHAGLAGLIEGLLSRSE